MTSEADALWAAVLEAPEDDAPRLVYADWLEEHGRPTGRPARPREFFNAPLLSTLHTLELVGLGLENGAVQVLARSGPLENLRELVLDGNPVGSGGLEALAGGRLRSLTRLSLRGAGGGYSEDPIVRSEGVEALAGSGVFANLESLDLTAQ